MRPTVAPLLAALLVATVLAGPAAAQPATARTPNLEGTWTTPAGTGFFAFLHRFQLAGTTVINFPTFHVSAGLQDWLSVGTLYATKAAPALAIDNELELFAAQRLLDEDAGAPLSLSLKEAWHANYGSPDGEVNLGRRLGPVALLGTARVLGRYKGGAGPRVSTGLGASVGLTPHLKLAADAAYAAYDPARAATEPPVVWGAGLQIQIPATPHTLSLQVSNAASATMHGAGTASNDLRYGFDFTVPLGNGGRWLDIVRPAAAAPAPAPAPAAAATTAPARSLDAAKAFFASSCAGCHGAAGQGGFGPDLRGVEAKGDGAIAERIQKGSPKGMPPFAAQLGAAELADLVAFVKAL